MSEINEKRIDPSNEELENPAEPSEAIENSSEETCSESEEIVVEKTESPSEENIPSETDHTPKEEAAAEEHTAYEEYDEYDDEDDADNLAAVAERITGSRHTVAATAAPIRVRAEASSGDAPKATAGIPVREQLPAENTSAAATNEQTAESTSRKRAFTTTVTAALAIFVILAALIVTVNMSAEKERPADITIGETSAENAEIISHETAPDVTEDTTADTDEPADTDDVVIPDTPVEEETEPLPEETEPETEPEPVKFTVVIDFFDKEDITIITEAITFGDLLDQVGYKLTDSDMPSVANNTLLTEESVIKIDKHVWLTDTETVEIPYTSKKVEIDTIARGTTNYLQYGENGTKTITYAVEYINGAEVARSATGEEVTKWPVEEIYEIGVGGSFIGSDGKEYTYSLRRVVPATYYNIEGLTYLGTMADESVIAVDRSYIPLGTKLYVKNANYDFGVRIASDVGSAIKGWEIDIWIDDSNPQLDSFAYIGYHWDMEIYYID